MRKIDQSIEEIPSEPVQEALTALLHGAQGDAVVFRHAAEQWFDDQMERVSGWYRRRIQKVLWILAFVVASTLNADALQIGEAAMGRSECPRGGRQPGAERERTGGKTPVRRDRLAPGPVGVAPRERSARPAGLSVLRAVEHALGALSKLIG